MNLLEILQHGPQSKAIKFLLSEIVIFDIPPRFKNAALVNFKCLLNKSWNIGVKGAPWPPFCISFSLKLLTTFIFNKFANFWELPICQLYPFEGLWDTVCPWKPITSIFFLLILFFFKNTFNFYAKRFRKRIITCRP